ncbi:M15 family metallopeptidase [Nocardioides sp. Arc9.136]|uniref:M15 family metallopeptidase n=1 Tax=Nocardioides sp. Arc9.136 TaxID=2996826 RepID=UPI002665EF0F|nr:M15 family metallopeptidase [Nocardioides sp. Arc9.136]WKN46552.1 M15 family metallopeptidase [Nocardioides sp. Arc9.136]
MTPPAPPVPRGRLTAFVLLVCVTAVGLAYLALADHAAPARRALLAEAHVTGVPVPGVGDRPGSGDGRVEGLIAPDADHVALDRLDPDLYDALNRAAVGAAEDGIALQVSSGWRSRAYQQHLLDAAIQKYGSREEALHWVETPDGSSHTSGDAVDVGPTEPAYWLSQHGSAYGLCQTYSNEIWHYELATRPGGACPSPR